VQEERAKKHEEHANALTEVMKASRQAEFDKEGAQRREEEARRQEGKQRSAEMERKLLEGSWRRVEPRARPSPGV
jgi:hypothetical protein